MTFLFALGEKLGAQGATGRHQFLDGGSGGSHRLGRVGNEADFSLYGACPRAGATKRADHDESEVQKAVGEFLGPA